MLIHLDTIQNNTFTVSSYNTTFNLNTPIIGCSNIAFKSIELPIQIPNIRAQGGLNVLKFYFDGNIYTATIAEGIYSDIATLISALNTSLVTALGVLNGIEMVASVNSSNKISLRLEITNVNLQSIVPAFTLIPTNFSSYILGFKNTSFDSVTPIFQFYSTLTSSLTYNLQFDNYVYLYISNVVTDKINITNQNFNNVHFKITLNTTNNIIYFYSDELSFKQNIQINERDIYNQLTIKFYDRLGFQLVGNFPDYSLTLEAY